MLPSESQALGGVHKGGHSELQTWALVATRWVKGPCNIGYSLWAITGKWKHMGRRGHSCTQRWHQEGRTQQRVEISAKFMGKLQKWPCVEKKIIFDMNFMEFIKERLRGDLVTGSKWMSFWSCRPRCSRVQGLESQVGHLSLEVRHFPDSKDN